jgi:anti-sigma B factor antagonist
MTDADAFSIQTSTDADAGVVVVAVAGEVDLLTAPELGKALQLVAEHTSQVVVDLTAVTFLDSSGINALLTGQRGLAARGTGFRVVAPEGPVRRIFEVTQLVETLGVVDSVDATAPPA